MGDLAERMAEVRYPGVLRRQQVAALAALEVAWGSGRTRAWVALPPGAGKTVIGLEAARRLGRPVVALVPNAAVQGQWVRGWRQFGPPVVRVGTERDLSAEVTVLTVGALAASTPDDEVDADGEPAPPRPTLSLHDRLHVNGRALVRLLQEAGPLTLVLDECAHLAEAWGHRLADLLDLLPDAQVVGLTASAPAPDGSDAATRVLGAAVHVATVPAAVRDGDLAPFAALARLVPPTEVEAQWLAEESERFRELVAHLLDPDLAPTGFLDWVQGRVAGTWADVEREEPDLAAAVLRLHTAGMLGLPPGARLREEHRRPPTGADWALLVDDYARGFLLAADDAWSREAFDRLRAGLPAVGWVLTRGGLRQGRT
ncbi:MAG: DEAD/DEAH box helicase family protein, partial [Actinomycetota bacterium]|nr:DEAD/DEAH box helicase family protein [Actinomycetota bacterium]